MASCSSLLFKEQFQCSICLDVFTDPVSTSCGHNFCKACITKYWDSNDLCQCPTCEKIFDNRIDLHVNTFISEMAAQFRKPEPEPDTSTPDLLPTKPEVSCDICTGTKLKALKSCLVCLASYCETHLEPHQRVKTFKKHKLMDPVENLEDRMCKKHDKLLELFCRKEQTCVCVMCIKTDHKTHCSVTLEEEYVHRKIELQEMMAETNQMIEARSRKIQEINLSIEILTKESERDVLEGVQVFSALVRSIERSQAELIEMIEEKQKEAEKQAETVIKELEQEISELKKRSTELEQLSHTEDHLHLLQSFPSLSTPPHTKDWSGVSIHRDLSVGAVRRAVTQLEETLNEEMEKLSSIELKRIQQYAVDVTLDSETANSYLILSEDGKQVSTGHIEQDLPDNPERFDECVCVLGKQGFSSGRFYYEVQVGGKTAWDLGVARQSIDRKGEITVKPEVGYWTIWLRNGEEYKALEDPSVLLSLRQKPQKVGVFVDYEEGLVSFYDVEARSHIYSYTGCSFSEQLYPLFSPSLNDEDGNLDPLVITSVTN